MPRLPDCPALTHTVPSVPPLPARSNPTTPFDPTMEGYNFIEGPDATPAHVRLGPTQTKALFVEYTDATFTVRKQRAAEDAYLGLLGPVLRAQVGDTIRVVFLNRASINASMHPHGVRYAKAHEGAPYEDGSDASQRGDDVVVPGKGYTYVWKVGLVGWKPGPCGLPVACVITQGNRFMLIES